MKKLPILLICTALLTQFVKNPVLAMKTDDAGGEYWYIPETLEYKKEVDEMLTEKCASSQFFDICYNNKKIYHLIDNGNRYQAVWQLEHMRFVITAVNPRRNTIRMYYTGWNSVSESEKADAVELYLYWLEDGKITPQIDWTKASFYTDKIRNNQDEAGMHVLFAKNEPQVNGSEWMKTGEETRIVLTPSSLTGNSKKQIFYTMINSYGDTYTGFYAYGDCLEEFGDNESMECRGAFYIKDNAYTYLLDAVEESEEDKSLPLSPLTKEPENLNEPDDDNPSNEPDDENISDSDERETQLDNDNQGNDDPSEEYQPDDDVSSIEIVSDNELNTSDLPPDISDLPEEEPYGIPDIIDEDGPLTDYVVISDNASSDENNEDRYGKSEDDNDIIKEPSIVEKSTSNSNELPKTPNTGKSIAAKSVEPPMPIIAIIGLLFVIWWITPVNKKKKQ